VAGERFACEQVLTGRFVAADLDSGWSSNLERRRGFEPKASNTFVVRRGIGTAYSSVQWDASDMAMWREAV